MDLKSAIAWLTPFTEDINLTPDHIKAVKTLLSFCRSVVECEGVPDVNKTTEIIWGRIDASDPYSDILKSDCEVVANEIHNLWQAWLAKAVDAERIANAIRISSINNPEILAAAIVKEIKGVGKEWD